MQYTPNYNLITVEGTDVVNPLVQMNPNFMDIDAAMFANKQAVIGTASEITSGTVHSITRSNPDSNYFRFTATSNWNAGDSMSVDGVNVSVYFTDGTVPGTGAYVINSEVFGIITGSRVTLMLSNSVTSIAAGSVTYDNTTSGLTGSDAQAAIDELATAVKHGVYEVYSNSVYPFAPQTITIPNDNYDTLIIELGYRNTRSTAIAMCEVGSYAYARDFIMANAGYITEYERVFHAIINGANIDLDVSNCTEKALGTYGSAPTSGVDNEYLVIYRILAVKHNA